NTSGNDDDRFLYAGRVQGTLLKTKNATITGGVNGFSSHDTNAASSPEFGFKLNTFTGYRAGVGADVQFVFGPAEIWTEYLRDRFEPASRIPVKKVEPTSKSILGAYTLGKFHWVARYDSYAADRVPTTKSWDA